MKYPLYLFLIFPVFAHAELSQEAAESILSAVHDGALVAAGYLTARIVMVSVAMLRRGSDG